jgi:transposase-like protein
MVEVDEFYIGASEEGHPGCGAEKKNLAIVAVVFSDSKKALGRIRLGLIPDASAESLVPFICNNVKPGSTVVTEGWSGYLPVKNRGSNHIAKPIVTDKELPHVHLVISLVKRGITGTLQGSISQKHLAFYLDEYVFRFNRRTSSSRGKLFRRLIEQAVVTSPITRKDITDIDKILS